MNLISSPGTPLKGTAALPGDKSISHRSALFAAIAYGQSRMENFLDAGVTRAMLDSLTALGVPWQLEGGTLTVEGRGVQGLKPPDSPLQCGNSGTTIRLLAGALAAANLPAVLDGSAGLRRRPMERIVDPLRQMGVDITSCDGHAPLTLRPGNHPLVAQEISLPVASAQLKTCLMLAALAAGGTTILHEPSLSRDHSERLFSQMGVTIGNGQARPGNTPHTVRITPPSPLILKPLSLHLPGDFSAAAFLIVAALITPGSAITLKNIGLNATRTGMLDALLAMGGKLRISNQSSSGGEPTGDLTIRHSRLHGIAINGEQVVKMIDEFPAFAVAAACANGITTVSDATELRTKESDRIAGICSELRTLGVEIVEKPDGFVVQGGKPLSGGVVSPHGDHRLAMSLAVAGGAASGPVTIQDANIIHESFPGFIETARSLGSNLALEGASVS